MDSYKNKMIKINILVCLLDCDFVDSKYCKVKLQCLGFGFVLCLEQFFVCVEQYSGSGEGSGYKGVWLESEIWNQDLEMGRVRS